jgi:DNA modification methylase
MGAQLEYNEFLKRKVRIAQEEGFTVDLSEINPALKPHNRLMVQWLVGGGRRACFARFGLHKTVTQLETVRLTLLKSSGKRALIVCPLAVRQEFQRDAVRRLGWEAGPIFVRRTSEVEADGIYITNYESVRDGKLDPHLFDVVSLDEASVLRGFGGSKTFREFMKLFTGDAGPQGDRRGAAQVAYRFVATATPSPNEYIELLAYADFLGIMDVSQAKTRFFKRDSTQADKLTLHAHKEEEYWLWVASWALFVQLPSDITGNPEDDAGYEMPPLDLRWHEIASDHSDAGFDKRGQALMFKDSAIGLTGAAKEKRDTLSPRVAKMLELREEDPGAHRILWHDLEPERKAIEKALPNCATVYGSQKLEDREQIVAAFSDGELAELGGKPSMLGSGTNLQRFCHWAIYLGIGFKFNDFIQSIHRLQRFGQEHVVRVDLIYTEAERSVRKSLERKWQQHNKQVEKMTEINKKFGLSGIAMAQMLTRKMGVERVEVTGKSFRAVNWDNVLETRRMEENSVGLILTSWPFANQYEYSPNYSDFGHTQNVEEFFQQMDYLTPETYRALMPGRFYAVHVKDRIIPGGMTGLGFPTLYPFHSDCIAHMQKHGFAFMGMKTIVTDVVRENKQTYRLGWSEQCKDGSKMGVGTPEYLLIFRKPQTDCTVGYSDVPVQKSKPQQIREDGTHQPFNRDENLPLVPGSGYSRSRWQVDAHGFARSSGDRLLDPQELLTLEHHAIFKLFRDYSLNTVYDFEHHVKIGETLEGFGRMPTSFMLLQPQSWHDDVWTDIARMVTYNSQQVSKGQEMHLCPFQIDLVKRAITQWTNPGDIVYDPFAGLFTAPAEAVKLGRFGVGCDLNPIYFCDGVGYCKSAEQKVSMPTLFDTLITDQSAA